MGILNSASAPAQVCTWAKTPRQLLRSLGILLIINTGITLIIYSLLGWQHFWLVFATANGIGLGCFVTVSTLMQYLWPRFGNDLRILLAIQPLAAFNGALIGYLFVSEHQSLLQTWVSALTFCVPASLVFYAISRLSESRMAAQQAVTARETARRQAVEMELRTLQNQIEPHFLFNTLANVSALIDVDAERAQQLLGLYTDFLRDSMRLAAMPEWPLASELQMVERYLQIQQVRFPAIRYEIDADSNQPDRLIPPLLLQPLVENAFGHGLVPAGNRGLIRIRYRRQPTALVLQVDDDGVGLTTPTSAPAPASVKSGNGLALENIRARLQHRYGPAASLTLERIEPASGPALTRATLRLPEASA